MSELIFKSLHLHWDIAHIKFNEQARIVIKNIVVPA